MGGAVALPACFHLADDVFPRVRGEAARRLLAQGMSQNAVAKRLGVSQAMVSKYAGRPSEDDALVLRLVEDVVDDAPHDAGPGPWCRLLSSQHEPGHEAALDDLLAAEQRLLQHGHGRLAPQVGINIARALPDATAPEHVLAYPARIVAAGDRLVRPVPPAPGASHHLARCLLALRRQDPSVAAICNIRDDPSMAVDATMGAGDRVEAFQAAIHARPDARIVRDPGAMGIEPCIYVAGPSARHIIDTILQHKVNQ